jgi:hypothetical protein
MKATLIILIIGAAIFIWASLYKRTQTKEVIDDPCKNCQHGIKYYDGQEITCWYKEREVKCPYYLT